MLEGLISWFLNNQLGKYLENVDTDQLSFSILQVPALQHAQRDSLIAFPGYMRMRSVVSYEKNYEGHPVGDTCHRFCCRPCSGCFLWFSTRASVAFYRSFLANVVILLCHAQLVRIRDPVPFWPRDPEWVFFRIPYPKIIFPRAW